MRIRVRAPFGVFTLSLADDASVDDLQAQIAEKTSLSNFDIKHGFPPKALDLAKFDKAMRLRDTGLNLDGEQLIILDNRAKEVKTTPTDTKEIGAGVAQSKVFASTGSPEPSSGVHRTQAADPPRKENAADLDPPIVPIPSHSANLVLRVMPDDNSCLFRALGTAVLGPALDSMTELRSLVAQGIQDQPDIYSDAVLGKARDEYCRWIQRPESWGGAIELGILAQVFEVEVCSINVQDLRVDRFNEGAQRRCILVYSGIHYDTIALVPSELPYMPADLGPEMDVKVFESSDEEILHKSRILCRMLQDRQYYTDLARFNIQCYTCGWKGEGEVAATKHAMESGHTDFGEAR